MSKKLVHALVLGAVLSAPLAGAALAAGGDAKAKCEKMTDQTKKAECMKEHGGK